MQHKYTLWGFCQNKYALYIVFVVPTLTHLNNTMQSVVAGQAPNTFERRNASETINKQIIVHMITEARLNLRRTQNVRSANVHIGYTQYAEQVATDAEKTTYYPKERNMIIKKTRHRKLTNLKGKKVLFRLKSKIS